MKQVIVLLLTLSCFGCVSTKVSSLKDPTYFGQHFHHVLVYGNFQKIEFQQKAEMSVVNELRHSGVLADPSYQVLPPLRTYSDSEKVAIFHAHGFDCYAFIANSGVGMSEMHVPTYTTANVAVSSYGNTATGYGSSTTSGGFTRNALSSADFELSLYDFNNGHKICFAQSHSSTTANQGSLGIQWVDAGDLLESASEHLADEMLKNDLFQSVSN